MKYGPGKNILFYPSGHGFGHSVRQIEIMKEILRGDMEKGAENRIFVRTMAPEWIFSRSFERYFEKLYPADPGFWRRFFTYDFLVNDTGTVQKDSLNMDIPETSRRAAKMYLENFKSAAISEYAYIRNNRISLVVGDIPPIAFEAAATAGVPSIGITNFSWDFIYDEFTAEHPEFRDIISVINDAYRKCGLLLSLPYSCPLDAFPKRREAPMIARRPYLTRGETLEKLGYRPCEFDGKTVAMISFGGFDTRGIKLANLGDMSDHVFLTTLPVENGEKLPSNVKYIDTSTAGVSFENLFTIFDVIVTKPGYGVCGDIIGAGSRVVYSDRGNFREYDYLVKMLEKHSESAIFIKREDLMNCDLGPAIKKAVSEKREFEKPDLGGAAVCANIISNY